MWASSGNLWEILWEQIADGEGMAKRRSLATLNLEKRQCWMEANSSE